MYRPRTGSSEERNIDIYRVVYNLTAPMKGLFFRGGNERLIVLLLCEIQVKGFGMEFFVRGFEEKFAKRVFYV